MYALLGGLNNIMHNTKDTDLQLYQDIAKQLEAYRLSRFAAKKANPKVLYEFHEKLLKRLAKRLNIGVL